jgi:GAF domain-containing protein
MCIPQILGVAMLGLGAVNAIGAAKDRAQQRKIAEEQIRLEKEAAERAKAEAEAARAEQDAASREERARAYNTTGRLTAAMSAFGTGRTSSASAFGARSFFSPRA